MSEIEAQTTNTIPTPQTSIAITMPTTTIPPPLPTAFANPTPNSHPSSHNNLAFPIVVIICLTFLAILYITMIIAILWGYARGGNCASCLRLQQKLLKTEERLAVLEMGGRDLSGAGISRHNTASILGVGRGSSIRNESTLGTNPRGSGFNREVYEDKEFEDVELGLVRTESSRRSLGNASLSKGEVRGMVAEIGGGALPWQTQRGAGSGQSGLPRSGLQRRPGEYT